MLSANRSITVLVVEDEFWIRAGIADRLRGAGFSVFEAERCRCPKKLDELFHDLRLAESAGSGIG
jgi:hypothetical protein